MDGFGESRFCVRVWTGAGKIPSMSSADSSWDNKKRIGRFGGSNLTSMPPAISAVRVDRPSFSRSVGR